MKAIVQYEYGAPQDVLGDARKPKFPVPGGDLAGTVERAGGGVTAFKPGDEVYGFGHGAFAEYITVHQAASRPSRALSPSSRPPPCH